MRTLKGPFQGYFRSLESKGRSIDYTIPVDLYPDLRTAIEGVRETRARFGSLISK